MHHALDDARPMLVMFETEVYGSSFNLAEVFAEAAHWIHEHEPAHVLGVSVHPISDLRSRGWVLNLLVDLAADDDWARAVEMGARFREELDIKYELPAKPDWELLLQLKAKWQTSIAALLYRSRTVGPMGEQTYVQAMKTLSARGWRKHEPGDLGEPESPLMLQRAFELSELNEVELSARTGIPIPLIREVPDSAEDDRPEVVI